MTLAPIVVVGPPGGGAGAVVRALASSPDVRVPRRTADGSFLDAVDGLDLAGRGFESHRLTTADAAEHGRAARSALARALPAGAGRPLLSGPRLALRVGFLAAAFPQARFVCVRPDSHRALDRAIARWRATAADAGLPLPGWEGPAWTLPLVPGWRDLAALTPEQIAQRQWDAIDAILREDLGALTAARCLVVDRPRLTAAPAEGLPPVCRFLGLPEHPAMAAALERPGRAAGTAASQPSASTGRAVARRARPATHSLRFAASLRRLGGALMLAAPERAALQTLELHDGRVMGATRRPGRIDGLEATRGRLLLAAGGELRDLRAAAGRLVLRTRLDAGDAVLGDVAAGTGCVWVVVERPWRGIGCLTAADGLREHWRAPGGSRVGGLALAGDRPGWATTLDGRLWDLGTGAVVASGLDAPRAPRLAGDRVWLLERRGLTTVGPSGAVRRVLDVEGEARGLAIGDGLAVIGAADGSAGRVVLADLSRAAVIAHARTAHPVGAVGILVGTDRPVLGRDGAQGTCTQVR